MTDHSLHQGNSPASSSAADAGGLLAQLSYTHSVTHKCTISHTKTARGSFTYHHACSSESQGDLICYVS